MLEVFTDGALPPALVLAQAKFPLRVTRLNGKSPVAGVAPTEVFAQIEGCWICGAGAVLAALAPAAPGAATAQTATWLARVGQGAVAPADIERHLEASGTEFLSGAAPTAADFAAAAAVAGAKLPSRTAAWHAAIAAGSDAGGAAAGHSGGSGAPSAARWADVQCLPEDANFCITTAINYTNGAPHFGHAYEAVVSDILARYHRAVGRNVLFCTGTDEHGQKIAEKAAAEGRKPIENCDMYAAQFQALNKQLNVSNDVFIRTTSPEHKKTAQWVWEQALKSGDIFLGKYEGWYNVREETFVTENEAQLTDYKDPVTGKPLQKQCEESYFFKMSKFQTALLKHINDNPEFIQPESRRNGILARLEEPLLDLSISRTTFDWGISVPNDPRHVMYVWFDALTNYLTGTTYPSGPRATFWPASVQIVGKDIVWFHTVIWPTMLMSAGIPLPKTVYAHGFVTDENGHKMSKSIGNVVDPVDVLKVFPSDSFRYYSAMATPLGNDLPFSYSSLQTTHNGILADIVGNLVHRVVNLTKKFCGGIVPNVAAEHVFDFAELRKRIDQQFAAFLLRDAAETAMLLMREANRFLTEQAPWIAKRADGSPKSPEEKQATIRSVLEATYYFAHVFQAFCPTTSEIIFAKLNTPARKIKDLSPNYDNLKAGTSITIGDILFVKIEASQLPQVGSDATNAAAPAMTPEELKKLEADIQSQGDAVRALKSAKAPKSEITAAVEKLLALKAKLPVDQQAAPTKSSKSKSKKSATAAPAAALSSEKLAQPEADR
eukprot:m.221047 g.221047  ORF g.221047 m.221047 type:complete len:776 (-) comp10805_c2_seq2:1614-3941(-)